MVLSGSADGCVDAQEEDSDELAANRPAISWKSNLPTNIYTTM